MKQITHEEFLNAIELIKLYKIQIESSYNKAIEEALKAEDSIWLTLEVSDKIKILHSDSHFLPSGTILTIKKIQIITDWRVKRIFSFKEKTLKINVNIYSNGEIGVSSGAKIIKI